MGKAPEIVRALRATRASVEWVLDPDSGQVRAEAPAEEIQEELSVPHAPAKPAPAPLPQPVQVAQSTWD